MKKTIFLLKRLSLYLFGKLSFSSSNQLCNEVIAIANTPPASRSVSSQIKSLISNTMKLLVFVMISCANAMAVDYIVWESDFVETIDGVTQTTGNKNDAWQNTDQLSWAKDTYSDCIYFAASGSSLTLTFDNVLHISKGDVLHLYWGATSNRTLSLRINDNNESFLTGASISSSSDREIVTEAIYNFVDDTDVSSLFIGGSGSGTYLFHIAITSSTGGDEPITTYTITYDLNGGEGTIPTETPKAANTTFTLASADGITKADNVFKGWNDDDDGQLYSAGAEYTMPARPVTFTASWEPSTSGGGDSEPSDCNVSIVFDNNNADKFNQSWQESDIITTGGAICELLTGNCSSDGDHTMTKQAIKGNANSDLMTFTLPDNLKTGTISIWACGYNTLKNSTIVIKANGTQVASGSIKGYGVTSSDDNSWATQTLQEISYTIPATGGEKKYTISVDGNDNIYIYAFSLKGTICSDDNPEIPGGNEELTGIVSISDATTWDFSGAASRDVQPTSEEWIILSKASDKWNANFAANSLAGQGSTSEYFYRSGNNCYQAAQLKFVTTVAGKVTVEFSDTGSSGDRKPRHLFINGIDTEISSNNTDKKTAETEVSAGEVLINAQIEDATGTPNGSITVRIYKVEFVPSSTIEPEPDPTPSAGCEMYFYSAGNSIKDESGNIITNSTRITGMLGNNNLDSKYQTVVIDGKKYTTEKRTGASKATIKFNVNEGKEATFYMWVTANTNLVRTFTIKKDGIALSGDNYSISGSDYKLVPIENLKEGGYEITTSENIQMAMLALKECDSCEDPSVDVSFNNNIDDDNESLCVGKSATLYIEKCAENPTSITWQKYNETSKAWETLTADGNRTTISDGGKIYTINTIVDSDEGRYRAMVEGNCTRTSEEMILTVLNAPVFNDFKTDYELMERDGMIVISDISADDATSYHWHIGKTANQTASTRISDELSETADLEFTYDFLEKYDIQGEVGDVFYLFCHAENACHSTYSTPIKVTITPWVKEICRSAVEMSDPDLEEFKFINPKSATLTDANVYDCNGAETYLVFIAPEGEYFTSATVTAYQSNDGIPVYYAYSTNDLSEEYSNNSKWDVYSNLDISTTLTRLETITFPDGVKVRSFRIGRNVTIDGTRYGETNGHCYVANICFTYAEDCVPTVLSVDYQSEYDLNEQNVVTPQISLVTENGEKIEDYTLTFRSSNSEIATVNAQTGELTFNGRTGNVVITAIYSGGDDPNYCEVESRYSINVICSTAGELLITPETGNAGSCTEVVLTVTLNGETPTTGNLQWYRNGSKINDATEVVYTATQSGVYTVTYQDADGGCIVESSNQADIANDAEPHVTKLVPLQYYHFDHPYLHNNQHLRHLFAVRSYGEYENKSYYLTGQSYHNGKATDLTITEDAYFCKENSDHSIDTLFVDFNKINEKANDYVVGDSIVLTCKAIDGCNNIVENSKKTVTIHIVDERPVMALICSGAKKDGTGTRVTKEQTVGGDFLHGYNPADLCEQTGKETFNPDKEWHLYTKLKETYEVVPVNGYADFHKLNYEPFDILFLTDYPKSSLSSSNFSPLPILDAMYELVDYRPMFSFKIHMVPTADNESRLGHPSKWRTKGFTTPSVTPTTPSQYMNITCYSHPMFKELIEGDQSAQEATYQQYRDKDDEDQIVYRMFSENGYDADKCFQGFESAAAENFVTIGYIHNNAEISILDEKDANGQSQLIKWTPLNTTDKEKKDRLLVVAAERQVNKEARMVFMSVNADAQSHLTETAEKIVLECLDYLLQEQYIIEPADCAYTFDNGEHSLDSSSGVETNENTGNHDWYEPTNWKQNDLPGQSIDVRVIRPAIVPVDAEGRLAVANSIRLMEEGTITIDPLAALTVTNYIKRYDGAENNPTEEGDIIIRSDATGNGSLIFRNDDDDHTSATVQMYTKATNTGENWTWQYIGVPLVAGTSARPSYYYGYLAIYEKDDWVDVVNYGPLYPFRGYCVSYNGAAGHVFNIVGELAETERVQEIAIPKKTDADWSWQQVVANSWTAPIQISQMTQEDFATEQEGIYMDQTIFFFNTGYDYDKSGSINGTEDTQGDVRYEAGTYLSVPINTAKQLGITQISSLQGFFIQNQTDYDGTFTLDYNKHVRITDSGNTPSNNAAMHAPRRTKNEPLMLKIKVSGSKYDDVLHLFEREDFSDGFDNGWDGEKFSFNQVAPNIFTMRADGVPEAVCAIDDFEGKLITFCAGASDDEYTLTFTFDDEQAEPLYLLDLRTNTYTRITDGTTYMFTCDGNKAATQRFMLTRQNGSDITTDISEKLGKQSGKALKFIDQGRMYIFVNGNLYDATGKTLGTKR